MDVKGCIEPIKVTVHYAEIERVNSFEYLGSLFEAEVDGRVGRRSAIFASMPLCPTLRSPTIISP